MRANILKKLNENMPEFTKYILSKNIRNRLIKNKIFIEEYNKISEYNKMDDSSKKEIQLKALKEQLIYAYENTKYYKKIFDKVKFNPYLFNDKSELNIIPLLTKNDILNNYDEFISKQNINYYEASTGGSTGKPLKIYLDKDSIYKEKAYIYNHWSKLGYDYRKSRVVTFRGIDFKGKIKKYNPLYNEIIVNPFIMKEDNIKEYVKIINNFKCEYLHGYPSAIYSFCKLIKKQNIKLSIPIKGVFFISENVYDEQRNLIEEVLNCKTLAFYGHSERSVFGEEEDRVYSFNGLYGYVEFETINDTDHIICTGLINKKMPLIRYLTDDSIEVKNNGYLITGHRSKNVLIGKNDENISMASMEFHSNAFEKVRAFQFEQNVKGKVIFYIVEDSKLSKNDIRNIELELLKKFNSVIEYEIKIVDKVKLTPRGKFDMLIQNIK